MSRPRPGPWCWCRVCEQKYVGNVVWYSWNAAEERVTYAAVSELDREMCGVRVILLRRNTLHSLNISITDFINIACIHVNVYGFIYTLISSTYVSDVNM